MMGMKLNKSGIYKITCLDNGIIYIGSSNNIQKRSAKHLRCMRKGDHCNPRMQNAFNKYGEKSFIFEVVEIVEDLNNLVVREQHYIDLYNVCKHEIGFNICPIAGSVQGRIVTVQARKNLSLAMKGRPGKPTSLETKIKQREAKLKNPTCYWLDKKHSIETRNKISNVQIGKFVKPETILKKSKTAIFIDVNGNEIKVVNLSKFSRDNNLTKSALCRLARNEINQYKGYRLKEGYGENKTNIYSLL